MDVWPLTPTSSCHSVVHPCSAEIIMLYITLLYCPLDPITCHTVYSPLHFNMYVIIELLAHATKKTLKHSTLNMILEE